MSRRLLTLALVLALPLAATAGPPYFIGEWGTLEHCPRGDYSWLHYWLPEYYKTRAVVHPSNVDQYVPAPCVPIVNLYDKQRCMPRAPQPNSPYANPELYYGKKMLPDATMQIP